MAKLRLCSRCGVLLVEVKPGSFFCPRGHGKRVQAISSVQVNHYNGATGSIGGVGSGGSKSKDKKRKKKPKMTPWWASDYSGV